MSQHTRVCSVVGCPELQPCPTHARPRNGPWGKRDTAAHNRAARAAKKAHPYCAICGSTDKLDAHHRADGSIIVLCNPHHVELDPQARPRP